MATCNFNVNRGSTFSTRITMQNSDSTYINLSGYTVSGQARYSYSSSGVLVDLAPTIYSHVSGMVDIEINATGTTALPIGEMFYDVKRYSGDYADKLVEGKLLVYDYITR